MLVQSLSDIVLTLLSVSLKDELGIIMSYFALSPVKLEGGFTGPQCGVPHNLPHSPGSSDGRWGLDFTSASSTLGTTSGAFSARVSGFVAQGSGGPERWARVPLPGSACCQSAAFSIAGLQVLTHFHFFLSFFKYLFSSLEHFLL